jgi:hypothetical protein
MEQLQSHIWLTATSYMGKYLRISSYIRKPFLIYNFATAPLWISLSMRKIWFSFLSVQRLRRYFLHCRYLEEISFLQRRRKDFLYCSDNQDWEENWDFITAEIENRFFHCNEWEKILFCRDCERFVHCKDWEEVFCFFINWVEIWSVQRLKIDFFIAKNEKRFLLARDCEEISSLQRLRRDFLYCRVWEKISSLQRLWKDFFIEEIVRRFVHGKDWEEISLIQKSIRD